MLFWGMTCHRQRGRDFDETRCASALHQSHGSSLYGLGTGNGYTTTPRSLRQISLHGAYVKAFGATLRYQHLQLIWNIRNTQHISSCDTRHIYYCSEMRGKTRKPRRPIVRRQDGDTTMSNNNVDHQLDAPQDDQIPYSTQRQYILSRINRNPTTHTLAKLQQAIIHLRALQEHASNAAILAACLSEEDMERRYLQSLGFITEDLREMLDVMKGRQPARERFEGPETKQVSTLELAPSTGTMAQPDMLERSSSDSSEVHTVEDVAFEDSATIMYESSISEWSNEDIDMEAQKVDPVHSGFPAVYQIPNVMDALPIATWTTGDMDVETSSLDQPEVSMETILQDGEMEVDDMMPFAWPQSQVTSWSQPKPTWPPPQASWSQSVSTHPASTSMLPWGHHNASSVMEVDDMPNSHRQRKQHQPRTRNPPASAQASWSQAKSTQRAPTTTPSWGHHNTSSVMEIDDMPNAKQRNPFQHRTRNPAASAPKGPRQTRDIPFALSSRVSQPSRGLSAPRGRGVVARGRGARGAHRGNESSTTFPWKAASRGRGVIAGRVARGGQRGNGTSRGASRGVSRGGGLASSIKAWT